MKDGSLGNNHQNLREGEEETRPPEGRVEYLLLYIYNKYIKYNNNTY